MSNNCSAALLLLPLLVLQWCQVGASFACIRLSLPSERTRGAQSVTSSLRSIAMVSGRRRSLPDDVTAGSMDTGSVVQHVMDAFRPGDEDDDDGWQFSNTQLEVAGSAFHGAVVLRSFSRKCDQKLDSLGQLQPGGFASSAQLEKYLLQEETYRTFALLAEWKPLGEPQEAKWAGRASGTSETTPVMVQNLLVRQADSNWEEARMTLELCETPQGARWLVSSIYKDYFDREAVKRSNIYVDDDGADPEESRDC